MSFFKNPELFIAYSDDSRIIYMKAFYAKFGTPIEPEDVEYLGEVVFTPHLSLGDNKMSDLDGFFAYLKRKDGKHVNCQGLMIQWSSPSDKDGRNHKWLPRKLDTSVFGLPAYEDPRAREKELATKLDACVEEWDREKAEKKALEDVIRDLETKISTLQQTISGLTAKNCALEGEVERVKNEKNALIIDLDGKNSEILTLYDHTILAMKAKRSTLEGEIERVKNEKNYMCKEDTKEASEMELQAPKIEFGV